MKELLGKFYGRLLLGETIGTGPSAKVECLCECGQLAFPYRANILSGKTRSCGCLRAELTKKKMTKHGDAVPGAVKSEYRIWDGMKQRCINPESQDFPDYGGRGITICSRWKYSYPNFLADMGRKPGPEYSIDRIDVDGNYEPKNCRWATPKQQANNTRWGKQHGKK